MRMTLLYRAVALCLIFSLSGCGWKVVPPQHLDQPAPVSKVADRVVLSVNDGVAWGGGRLGDIVRDTLKASGTFTEVYYPVEPRNPPDLKLLINAKGNVDEEIGGGILKSIFIGLLLFIPVGVIRFGKTYNLDAEVVLSREGKEERRFNVMSKTEVSHTMFTQGEEYEPAAREAAFKDLGLRIAEKLSVPK
jgi:hypothetical protein